MELPALAHFIDQHQRVLIITGAGCSTSSGIPDYRDQNGQWKRPPPMDFDTFMHSRIARQRYWARSFVGWEHFHQATPNGCHTALATLEAHGKVHCLITQNVDGLHQAAGSQHVIDLHGRLDRVRCMGCEQRYPRHSFQVALKRHNPGWAHINATIAPDGDADLDGVDFARFFVPDCPACRGILKPDVVYFGEPVPRMRVEQGMAAVQQCDAVLVVGSSLMVFSGYRFVRAAAELNRPIAAINMGHTRADALLSLKVEQPCDKALSHLLQQLNYSVSTPSR